MRGVCRVVRPLRAEYQAVHKALRSCAQAAEHFAGVSAREFGRAALRSMADSLTSGSLLKDLGFYCAARKPSHSLASEIASDASHPEILRENLLVGRLMSLSLNLIKARLRSLSWFEHGYPGSFAGLLLGGNVAKELLALMEKDWSIYKHMQAQDRQDTRYLLARSPFKLVVVQKVMSVGHALRCTHPRTWVLAEPPNNLGEIIVWPGPGREGALRWPTARTLRRPRGSEEASIELSPRPMCWIPARPPILVLGCALRRPFQYQ